jgi:hypothetical protein
MKKLIVASALSLFMLAMVAPAMAQEPQKKAETKKECTKEGEKKECCKKDEKKECCKKADEKKCDEKKAEEKK